MMADSIAARLRELAGAVRDQQAMPDESTPKALEALAVEVEARSLDVRMLEHRALENGVHEQIADALAAKPEETP